MTYSKLGFDFSNLQSCTLYKKSRTFLFVIVIMFFTFLFIGAVFLALYLNDTPMTINGVMSYPGELAYERSQTILMVVFGGLDAIFLAMIIYSLTKKPNPYLYMDSDPLTNNQFYYITKHGRNNEIYLTKDYAIIYQTFTKSIDVVKSPDKIKAMHKKYIPWYALLHDTIVNVDNKEKHTIVRVNLSDSRMSKIYKFSTDVFVVPASFTETIGYFTTLQRKITSYNSYSFDLVNRSQQFDIHPDIKKELHSLIQTM